MGERGRYRSVSWGAGTAADGGVRPSVVTLPAQRPEGIQTMLEFFMRRFPRIPEEVWRRRFADGKVWSSDGPVPADGPFLPLLELRYRREVEREPPVRRDVAILWSDDDLLVVDKPPHLPVTPGGPWVCNCLLHILGEVTGDRELAPLHRLDRLTSGLVMFSRRRETRSRYAGLFRPGAPVEKIYTAVCEADGREPPPHAFLEHHVARSPDEYWRQVVVGDREPNARCRIELLAAADGLALYRVRPETGRKHQIRVQLAAFGLPILGDPLYGSSPFHDPEDLATRLWLDAHELRITEFPRPGGGGRWSAVWTSARDPDELWLRARQRS
jgi:tRNA pseudouridine32 synthase/23S rRNA pseudouridine746 synthase